MSLTAFVEQENGNLKYIAETEEGSGEENAAPFIEALLEEMPKQREVEAFIVLDTDEGKFYIVENVEEEVPATVKRVIRVAGSNGAEAEEDEAPKPRKRAAAAKGNSVKEAAAANRATQTAKAKAKTATKAASSGGKTTGTTLRRRGGFKRNAASDD